MPETTRPERDAFAFAHVSRSEGDMNPTYGRVIGRARIGLSILTRFRRPGGPAPER